MQTTPTHITQQQGHTQKLRVRRYIPNSQEKQTMSSTKYHQLRNLEHLAIKAEIVQQKLLIKQDKAHQKNLLIAQKLEKKQFLETCSYVRLMFTKAEKTVQKPRRKSVKKATVVAPVPVVPMEAVVAPMEEVVAPQAHVPVVPMEAVVAPIEEEAQDADDYIPDNASDNYNYHTDTESDDDEPQFKNIPHFLDRNIQKEFTKGEIYDSTPFSEIDKKASSQFNLFKRVLYLDKDFNVMVIGMQIPIFKYVINFNTRDIEICDERSRPIFRYDYETHTIQFADRLISINSHRKLLEVSQLTKDVQQHMSQQYPQYDAVNQYAMGQMHLYDFDHPLYVHVRTLRTLTSDTAFRVMLQYLQDFFPEAVAQKLKNYIITIIFKIQTLQSWDQKLKLIQQFQRETDQFLITNDYDCEWCDDDEFYQFFTENYQ